MCSFNLKTSILLVGLTSLALAAPHKRATCDRVLLVEAADAYLDTIRSGNVSTLTPILASNWTYTENNKVIDATTGVIAKSLVIDHSRTNYDYAQCATYTELISASDASKPFVIGSQIRHNDDGKVNSIDIIASTTNSWLFNATKTLSYVVQERWDTIPEGKRDKREAIQAAGDAYMDMWSNATAHQAVPWGTPCTRLEGSAYTGKGAADDSCQPGIPSNHNQKPNTHRRYVIDEEMGSVSIFCIWEHMMNAADSHEFRLEDGKLRYVHTMTECGGKPCKL
ncbi:hypothetical protein BDV96DRAFT_496764 [Lophiotrema nucula]|uniref:DUF8021 domain-containing protein n=1 Tax=Lophiotrema nucula TaxID=690887 RepID=A0A6A5Z3Q2_9PLEO|nr:hypothetical protein BDV96DRAFT_496764 [Lophiotrema nucula]